MENHAGVLFLNMNDKLIAERAYFLALRGTKRRITMEQSGETNIVVQDEESGVCES